MPGNPALNEKTFARERVVAFDPTALQPGRRTTMSIDGVVQKTALLLALVVAAGYVGWHATPLGRDGLVSFPVWILPGALVAFGIAILTFYRPRLARFTGPTYAILEGLVAGAISAAYEARFQGIVLQAVGLTIAVTGALLLAFATGRIRVTPKFQMIVISATFGILVIYLVQLLAHAFGSSIPFLFSSGLFGTLFSVAVCVIAASNLLLDFNFIQRGIETGTDRHMEWYAGFAICVHLVWLYLEVLRLLGRLRNQ